MLMSLLVGYMLVNGIVLAGAHTYGDHPNFKDTVLISLFGLPLLLLSIVVFISGVSDDMEDDDE